MGNRYEKNRKNVSDNKQTLERLRADKDTLRNEFSSLSILDSIRDLLDDEASDAIRDVKAVGEYESQRIESETDTAEEEKDQIAGEINQEIAKLNAGLEKLRRASGLEFGKRAVEQSSQEYRKQIDKFKSLIGELGEHTSDGGSSGGGRVEGMSGIVSDSISDTPSTWNEGETVSVPHMEPNRSTPRDLPQTQYGFTKDSNGNLTYDSPMEMDKHLYAQQGSAYTNFQGTCGLCSCANILRLSGVDVTEKDMIDYAASAGNPGSFSGKLCEIDPNCAYATGGTGPDERKEILEHFGISSGVWHIDKVGGMATEETVEQISDFVSDGRGVILSVHASVLNPEMYLSDLDSDFHAVTVTSVSKNDLGEVVGFYICDSNSGTSFYDVNTVRKALTGNDMNYTHQRIR